MPWSLTSGRCPRRSSSILTGRRAPWTCGTGRRLFAEVGCATCHAPTLGDVRGIYSDLLLHDMGQSLSDSGSTYGIDGPDTPEGPTPREWRTPPLWGYRDSGPYLHDGRAQDLEEAVALARRAGQRFGTSVLRALVRGNGPRSRRS